MKRKISILAIVFASLQFSACNNNSTDQGLASSAQTTTQEAKGQSGVQDDVSAKNVVQILVYLFLWVQFRAIWWQEK